jgi:hypothetical protein
MTGPGFLEVDPPVVRQAGERTAGTAELWQSWGNRIGISFRYADSALHSPTILAAMQRYGEGLLPAASRVSQQVYDLGVGAASAASTVESSDIEGAEALDQPGAAAADQASLLRRGINIAPAAPVDGAPVAAY